MFLGIVDFSLSKTRTYNFIKNLMAIFRYLCVASLLGFVAGCGGSTTPVVLDQTVEKDPSLGDDYYDQEKYNEMMKGPKNP